MNDAAEWEPVFRWGLRGLWLLIASMLVRGWLARGRRSAVANEPSQVLRHSLRTRTTATVTMVLLCAFTAGALAFAKERSVGLVFGTMTVLSMIFFADAIRVRHTLTANGIVYRGLWRRYDCVPWDSLVSARWNRSSKELVVSDADGRVVRFQGLLNGFDALAAALHDRATFLETDEATAKVLSDARRGTLPPVW